MEDLKPYQSAIETAKDNASWNNSWGFLGNNVVGKLLGFDSVMNNKQSLMNSYYSNAYNSAEAAKNRNFQEEMSNTSYQRASKDLTASGFSPLALLQPGNSAASTPSGSTASSSGGASVHGSGSAGIVSSILRALIGVGVNSSIANANLSKAAYFSALKSNITPSGGSSSGGSSVGSSGARQPYSKDTLKKVYDLDHGNKNKYSNDELKEIYRLVKTPWLDDD